MGPGKILVVDDNDAVRSTVSEMLSCLGYDVLSADSGESGLSVFLRNEFDIVLSDYEMPGMDGVAFASSIKKHTPGLPVVIMTGSCKEDVITQNSHVVDRVITKPFTLEEIDAAIQNFSVSALVK